MNHKHKRTLVVLAVLAALVACCGGAGAWLYNKVATAVLISYSQSQLHIIWHALYEHASEHGGEYPTGYGVLVWSGAISPELLVSPFERSEAIDEYDWDQVYTSETPPPGLDAFIERNGSYVVLVWGQPRTDSPDVLFAYERLRRGSRGTPLIYADRKVLFVPNAEAERLIRAAGHEPVWAD